MAKIHKIIKDKKGRFMKGNTPFDRTGISHTEETKKKLREARKGRTPNQPKDMLGRKFNRLLVINRDGCIGKQYAWLCECECGKRVVVAGYSLRSGQTKSCGCWTKDRMKELGELQKGKKHPNYGKPSPFRGKKKLEHGKRMVGDKNPNWRGGITPENRKLRNSERNKLWRQEVFIRDNFTCRKCNGDSNKLRAHHIQNFAQYPELRFVLDNGITFCDKCHKMFHRKFGIKNNNSRQIKEFLCLE